MLLNRYTIKSLAVAGAVAALTIVSSITATAGPIIHNGATFEIITTPVDANTAIFHYTADFTKPAWQGSGGLDYIFAIDFKLAGYTVDSIDAFSTNAGGNWVVALGNTNANGCSSSGNQTFVCAQNADFSERTGALTDGILSWDFTVSFTTDLGFNYFLSDANHIGAFFQRCDFTNKPKYGDARRCKPGMGLSQEVSFVSTGPGP